MKRTIIFTIVLLFFGSWLQAQSRTIYGRVIDDNLQTIGDVWIQNQDSLLLEKTDGSGRFKISLPLNEKVLIFTGIGLEPATIKLSGDCDTIDVVMMVFATYDFMSSGKVDRFRLKEFNKLPEIYLQAYNKGIFRKKEICYSRKFQPEKARLDEIGKQMANKEKQIKLTFEKLNIGDTVKIPFSGEFHHNTTDTILLNFYSIFAEANYYNCIIKGVILKKKKYKWHYNLIYKVTNCDLCKYIVTYENKVVKVGEVFSYNMKDFKILSE